jgi:hypothetical protein
MIYFRYKVVGKENAYKYSNSQIYRIYSIESKNQVKSNYLLYLQYLYSFYRAETVLKTTSISELVIDYIITRFNWQDRQDDLSNLYIGHPIRGIGR